MRVAVSFVIETARVLKLMKFLFINSKSPDYIEDQLFSALTEMFGKQSVRAYPVNYRYYIQRKAYPLNMGKCRAASDYIIDKLTLKNELKAFEYDCVIIGSTKRRVRSATRDP